MRPTIRRGAGVVLAAALALIPILALAVDEPRSAFSSTPASDVIADAESLGYEVRRLVSGPAELADVDAQDTVLAVLHAPVPYQESEVDAARKFLEQGGALLVIDPQGHGTQLALVAGLSLERVRLAEPTGFFNATFRGREFRLNTENATAVKLLPGAPAEVYIWSSASSHIDRDGNGTIDLTDPLGPFPILASAAYGRGRVWVLSAPSSFASSVSPGPDDALFREALLREVMGPRSTLILDESRMETANPLVVAARTVVRTDGAWSVAVVILAVLAFAAFTLVARGGSAWRAHDFNPRRFLERRREGSATHPRSSGWTRRGFAAMALAAACSGLGIALGRDQATWAGGICLAALAGALVLRAPAGNARRSVSSARVQESTTVEVDVEVRLRQRGSGVQLRDALDGSMEVVSGQAWGVPASRDTRLRYVMRPSRLGNYDIGPFQVQRQDALVLRVARRDLLPPDALKVTPRIEKTRKTPFLSKSPQIVVGAHVVQRAGSGSEFLTLREYQPGDPLRSVNWRASARSNGLVVNQRVRESTTELTVLLDVRAVSDVGPAEATPFVVGARAAASITAGAMASRDRVRVVLYGDGVHRLEGRGADHQKRFEEKLAETRPQGSTHVAQAFKAVAPHLRPGRPVVVITGAEADPTLMETLRSLRRRRLRPFLLSPPIWVSDDATSQEREIATQRSELIRNLRGQGFPVYETAEGRPLESLFRIQGMPT